MKKIYWKLLLLLSCIGLSCHTQADPPSEVLMGQGVVNITFGYFDADKFSFFSDDYNLLISSYPASATLNQIAFSVLLNSQINNDESFRLVYGDIPNITEICDFAIALNGNSSMRIYLVESHAPFHCALSGDPNLGNLVIDVGVY